MISVDFTGRLGNQMFQLAILKIIAKNNNYNFFIKLKNNIEYSPYWLGETIFDTETGEYNINYNFNNVYDGHNKINSLNELYNISDNTLIKGYFQNVELFENYYNDILNWFKIKENINITTFIDRYHINEYCYIHFRGGDYKDISSFYLPKTYYDNAKKYVLNNYDKSLKFLVITDDILEARKFFPDDEIMNNSMEIDFKLLNYSRYSIISNSTFSWWTRYLNNNINSITIAPKGFFNYNTTKQRSLENLETNKFTWID